MFFLHDVCSQRQEMSLRNSTFTPGLLLSIRKVRAIHVYILYILGVVRASEKITIVGVKGRFKMYVAAATFLFMKKNFRLSFFYAENHSKNRRENHDNYGEDRSRLVA